MINRFINVTLGVLEHKHLQQLNHHTHSFLQYFHPKESLKEEILKQLLINL